jgi:hypothetical protein
MIEDPLLQAALYITLSTKSTAAENISLDEIGKLKISPGANPFGIWERKNECEMFYKTVIKHKVTGFLLNTGGYFMSEKDEKAGKETDIPKELSIKLYPLLAADKIEWVDWDMMPGVKIPAPGSMEKVFKDYDKLFSVDKKHLATFRMIFKARLLNRIDWMEKNDIGEEYIDVLRKAQ